MRRETGGYGRVRGLKYGVLQVTTPDGRRRDLPLELPSLVVGRAEGNDLILDDLSVSRRHARLVVDSGRLLIEDLNSSQGTFVNGERIEPGASNLVEDGAELRFGEIVARFVPAPPTDLNADDEEEDLSISSRLGLTLTTPRALVYAGAPWEAELVVHNRSSVVDRVSLSVPDLPEDWVRFDRTDLSLQSGASAVVKVTIIPPRKAESLAGEYDFTIQVTSHEHQRDASVAAKFELAPYRNLSLSFEAPRSKRDFLVVAENKGNEAATYTLTGEDPDGAWKYDFELPAVSLQPGEKRTVGLRVTRPRQLMGIAMALPFNVHAEAADDAEDRVSALGQLAINPPLQKFRAPAMFVVAAVVIAAVAIGIMLIRSDEVVQTANAEDAYDGVHLCDPEAKAKADERAQQEAAEQQAPGGTSTFVSGQNSGAPYFAQNDPRWGKDEYARAKDPEFGPDWCGSTIEQCGCAMTSVATTMALFGLLTMPDGSALTPQSLNSWFNADAKKTNRGWVSRGYIYGDVIWTAANQLSGEMAEKNPGSPTIRFSRTGSGSDEEIKEQLRMNRPIILEVPGHWIAAVGLDGDQILINDPFYRDRKTLDVYKGKVKSSVLFEPSQDLSAVVFTAPADVRVRITDKQGRVVGTLATGSAEDAEKEAAVEIPGASYSSRQAWRDPSCIESAPPADAGTNQIILPGSADDYKVEVLDAGGKPTSIAIHTYDRNGKSSVQTIDNPGSAVAQVAVGDGKSDVKVIVGAQPTPQPTTDAGGGGGADDRTVGPTSTPTRVPTPTATPEPIVETGISIATIPGDNFVAIQSQDGFSIGDEIILSPGKANEEENRIVGFGSFILEFPLKFAHSPGEVIRKKPRPPGSAAQPTRPLPTPVVIPPLTAPESLVLGCSAIYVNEPKEATVICTLDITGTFTTTRWSLNGKAVDELNNQQLLLMSFNTDGNAAVGVSVCNRTICKSTSFQQRIQFPAAPTSGTAGTAGGTTGGTGGTALPTQTPPASGVVVTCNSQFEQGANPRAEVTCGALFSGPSTSVSWSAPGGQPAAGQGKTFTTYVPPGGTSKLRITATVCNFAACQTSPTVEVGIGSSTTKVFLKNNPITNLPTVPLNSTTTFTAIVSGPVPPAGGTVQFNDGLVPLGPSVPLFTAGAVGFAQMTLVTGTSPLVGENSVHPINAVYSGGTNLFGSFSPNAELTLLPPVPEICNGIDDDTDIGIDNGCDLSLPRDIGGGTIVQSVNLSAAPGGLVDGNNSGDIVVRPGTPVTVNTNLIRFPDCPNCIRQVYLGVAPSTVSGHGGVAPVCVFTGGLGILPPGTAASPWTFNAPSAPGIYYVRASSTLDFSCLQNPPLGPHDMTIARIVVNAASTTTLDVRAGGVPVTGVDDGTEVTVVVSVSPVPPTPGVIRLFDGGAPVAADQPLNSQGQATFTFTPTAAGSHLLRATYFGYPASAVFAQQWYETTTAPGGNEQQFDLAVRTDSTTELELTAAGAPTTSVTVGTTVTARVTVTPDITFPMAGSPVTISAGGVQIPTNPATPVLDANGEVTFTFVAGDVGVATVSGSPYNITATFAGATYVAASTSTSQRLAVTRANSSTALVVTPTSITAGETISMTATITGAPFAPPAGGIVTFKAGSQVIGTATVGGAAAGNCIADPPVVDQTVAVCRFITDQAPIDRSGTYAITAEFDGSGTNLNNSTSAATNLAVDAAPVTVTVTPSAPAVDVGGAGTLTITVAPQATGKVPGAVSGTVTLSGFTTPPGVPLTLTLSNPPSSKDGVATFNTNQINAGAYANIVAHYDPEVFGGGSTKYAAADSAPAALTVNKITPVVTLTAPAAFELGDNITLTATMVDNNDILQPDGGDIVFYSNGNPVCGVPWVAWLCPQVVNGTATLSGVPSGILPFDVVAGYVIVARYSGNPNLNAADSLPGTLNIGKATPTVSLSIATSPATIGDSVTFTANLTAGRDTRVSTVPGGTVSFFAGANPIATNVALTGDATSATATANFVTGAFPFDVGGWNYNDIKAVYSGNAAVNTGESALGSLQLNKAATTTTLAPITGVTLGQSATFNVTVTTASGFNVNQDGTPPANATVQFRKNGANIGSPVTVVGGTASLTVNTGAGTDFTTAGSYNIDAVYTGTSKLLGSTSGTQALVIAKASTNTSLALPALPMVVGEAKSLTATVTGNATVGTVTGSVTFYDGAVSLGSASVSGGQATLSISTLDAGIYSGLVATYNGDEKYDTSSSTPSQSLTIDKGTPTVTLANPGTATIGTSVTFSATVSSPNGISPQGGTVTFKAGTNVITTATVGAGGVASASVTTGTSPLDTGGFTYSDITATFEGTSNLNAVTSAQGTLILNKAAATVTLNNIGNVPFGTSATFTATVTASNANAIIGNGVATVTFTMPGGYTDTVTLNAGTASVTLTAGTAPIASEAAYTITATYNGSSQVSTGSANDSFNVVKATPAVSVTNNGPVTVGSSVTLSATVSATGVSTDGGVVTFRVGASNIGTSTVGGAISPGCGGGTNSIGQAICVAGTGSGQVMDAAKNSPFTVTADYAGTTQVATGTATTSVTVNRSGPTVSFTGGTGSVALGSSVTFVVNVSGNCSGGNTTNCPNGGTVSLRIGSLTAPVIQTATLVNNTATFTAIVTGASPFANAGNYTIIARFNGDDTNGNLAAADVTGTLTLNPVAPTVTVTSSAASGTAATQFTLTATVSPNFSPAGQVQFYDSTLAANIGTPVTLSSGNSVQLPGVTFAVGSHVVTAIYTNTSGNYSGTPTYVTVTITIS